MKTCRILNKEGARELLKEQVWLNSERQLVSFVLFMLADKRIRFAALREFYLELDEDISQNSGEMLSDLFVELSTAANTRLQKLRLSWETEDILLAHPRLSEGIAHLTTLKAINISCVGSQGSRLLTNLRSSLTYAAVDFDRDALDRKTSLSDGFDPLPLLQTSRNTLESLQLSHAWYMLTSNIVAYPRLTTLTVASRWVPYVPILHRAFPNLTEITSYFGIACTPLEIPSISIVAEYRAANRTYQLNHGSWAEFDSFHGPSRDLYILGLLCRIQYIDLCHYLGDSIDVGGLQTILSDTRPTHLLLSARLQPDDTFLSEQWMVALFQTRTPPLRALEVTMEVSQLNCNHEDMLYDALDKLCDALGASSLWALRLTFKGGKCPKVLQDLDVEELAYRLHDAADSLKVVAVYLSFESFRRRCWLELGSVSESLELQIPRWDWTNGGDDSDQEDYV